MFTGIIRNLGKLVALRDAGSNRIFEIEGEFGEALRVDQSIAHDGVCLTVTEILRESGDSTAYSVTAIEETLRKTRLGDWRPGDLLNLELSLRAGERLDGHFVQGHVDTRGEVLSIEDRDGSWNISFAFDPAFSHLLVPKGSICVNGVSLTVVDCGRGQFSVAIIPYTWTHTNFHQLRPGSPVNLEFDILGKYIHQLAAHQAAGPLAAL
jgi:riboflavin synthase